MENLSVSAPGKLFLGGEYAVLRSGQAVVTAVDRRAVARISVRAIQQSDVVSSASRHSRRFIEKILGKKLSMPCLNIDTSGFRIGRTKIGLGSSAAVAASSCRAYLEWAGLDGESLGGEILELAIEAHSEAQERRGSGADVAASVLGGTLIFTIGERPEPIDLSGVHLVAVWTGRSASTKELLETVGELEQIDRRAYRSCFDELVGASFFLAEAYRVGEPSRIVDGTAFYGEVMKRLGKAAGAPIVTSEHDLAARLAKDLGGAAKPSGAGGGDTAVAVFVDPAEAERFTLISKERGLEPLDLGFGVSGLDRQS